MMVRMQIQFTEAQAAELRAAAAERGMSISAVVRERVEADEPARAEPADSTWEIISKGFGKYRSGVTDLAENHDEYFAEAVYERKGHPRTEDDRRAG